MSWCNHRAALSSDSVKISWSPYDPRVPKFGNRGGGTKGNMSVLKVFSYTWLTTLPSTHVTRSSEAVLVKYNYNYFFPRPNKHTKGSARTEWHTQRDVAMQAQAEWQRQNPRGPDQQSQIGAYGSRKPPAPSSSRGSSLPAPRSVPAPPPAPSKSPYVKWADIPGNQHAKAETAAYTEAEHRGWVRDFQYDEEGLCRSWPVPSERAERAEPGRPPQPKPSQAPYLASEENSEKA